VEEVREFLAHVWPAAGPYCIAEGIRQGPKFFMRQICVEDQDEAVSVSLAIDKRKHDVFFAVGALLSSAPLIDAKGRSRVNRTAENIRALRTYFLDLDVKPGAYESQKDALVALREFCTVMAAPRPTIVSSGGGIHVYWTLTEDVPRDTWIVTASSLKRSTIRYKLLNDTKLVANSACVLRVAGTHNWKFPDNPRPVKVLSHGE
jgi:hypothetical protein